MFKFRRTQWPETANSARFRASADQNIDWDLWSGTHFVQGDLLSSHGRILVAFSDDKVRDWFVATYRRNEAQTEQDWSVEAKPFEGPQSEPVEVQEGDVHAFYERARETFTKAEQTLLHRFFPEIRALLASDEDWRALELIQLLPRECALRMLALKEIEEGNLHDFDEAPLRLFRPKSCTAEQINKIIEWQDDHFAYCDAEWLLNELHEPRVRKAFNEGGYGAAIEYVSGLPLSKTAESLHALVKRRRTFEKFRARRRTSPVSPPR